MKRDIPRVFLDSNIWFSAFYGSSNCGKLVNAHIVDTVKAVVSRQVIEESVRNIKEKNPRMLAAFQNSLINHPPEIIADPDRINPKIKESVDSKDQPIFSSAVKARVKYFITGNAKDFQIKKLERITGIKVITPKEAVEMMKL